MAIAGRHFGLALALTAGRDSRVVLAIAAGLGLPLVPFTIAHAGAELDVAVARELAQAVGLGHRALVPRAADAAAQALWTRRSGHVVGGVNRKLHPTLHALGAGHAILTGTCGEVGRGFYWNGPGDAGLALTPRGLARRLDLAPEPRVLAALEGWLAGTAGMDGLQVLDLAYLEHRLGAWAAPQQLGDPHQAPHPGPLQSLELFDCLMSLPPDWRWQSRWVDHIVASRCPRLAAWPYNRHRSAWRNLAAGARKALSRDRLRRRLSGLGGGRR